MQTLDFGSKTLNYETGFPTAAKCQSCLYLTVIKVLKNGVLWYEHWVDLTWHGLWLSTKLTMCWKLTLWGFQFTIEWWVIMWNRTSDLLCDTFGSVTTDLWRFVFLNCWTIAMKLLMLFIGYYTSLKSTSQTSTVHIPCAHCYLCRKAYPTTSLCFIFSPSPDLPHPSGFKQDPLPDPKPRTSLHLSLPPPDGKNTSSLSLLCVSPPPVEWSAGFVMLLSNMVVLSGFMGVHQGTLIGPLTVLILLALFTCVCGSGCCHAWFNLTLVHLTLGGRLRVI